MLKEITINNGYMTSEFDPEVFYYEVELEENANYLDFDYEAEGSVSIYGNDNLTYGDNHILVEVYKDEVVTYTFLVHKEKSMQTIGNIVVPEEPNIKQNNLLNDIKAPGIAGIAFFVIVVLFCIIFRKK